LSLLFGCRCQVAEEWGGHGGVVVWLKEWFVSAGAHQPAEEASRAGRHSI